jgi:single-strand DNA-binding protein
MMAGLNKVLLIGNLGMDPEVKHFDGGTSVARVSLATSESYKNKQGEKVTQTEWHSLELWEGLAKIAEQFLKKGSSIYVEGKIKTEKYTDAEGVEKKAVKIRVTSLVMLGTGSGSNDTSDTNETPNAFKSPSTATKSASGPPVEDDELPF